MVEAYCSLEVPAAVMDALAAAKRKEDAEAYADASAPPYGRVLELVDQLVAVWLNGEPDPANHDDYALWRWPGGLNVF